MRIQYELSDKENAEIELLMKDTGIKTKRDFINNAITLFEWAINERKIGHIVGSIDEKNNKYKEIIMPSMANIRVS